MREAMIFVVDGRRLEAFGLMLASTLIQHHPDRAAVQIIAYVTTRSRPTFSAAVRDFFERHGVAIRYLANIDDQWKWPYPHGNKILACCDHRDVDRTTFLDTDILCCGVLSGIEPEGSAVMCAIPEGRQTWGKKPGSWEKAYEHFGLPMPLERVMLSRRRLEHLPYFNAGFINFPQQVLVNGTMQDFGKLWFDTAMEIDHNCVLNAKRPWLDQITLPLTLYRYGIRYRVLSDLYNYSIADRVGVRRANKSRVIHYHKARYLPAFPGYLAIVEQLMERVSPTYLHDTDALLDEMVREVPIEAA